MKLKLLLYLLISSTSLLASEDDTLKMDSTKVHSIKRATIFSTCLPGLGQIYNHTAMPKGKKKAYWKVPLIYAGLGLTGYFAISNNIQQRDLKAEYNNRVNAGIVGMDYINYDDQGVLQLYNQKLNRRDLFFLGMGLVYLIQIADAAVEAHFVNFDVSDNLSLNIRPTVLHGNAVGISLNLKFR